MNGHVPLLIAGVLAVCAALAIVLRMRKLEAAVDKMLRRAEPPKHDRERDRGDHAKRDDVVQLRQEVRSGFDSLRSAIDELPAKVARSVSANANAARAQAAAPASSYVASSSSSSSPQQREAEDPVTHLLGVANRVMQNCPATIDEVRASIRIAPVNIAPWRNPGESTPVAFVVEHRGSCYAIPNVIKSARFPQAWFNGGDFGMNDEIQRVVALPRLRRSGDQYEVQEPGVFSK